MVARFHRRRGGAGRAQRGRCAGGGGGLRCDAQSDLPRRPRIPRTPRNRVSRHPGRPSGRAGPATAGGGRPSGSTASRPIPPSGAAAVAARGRARHLGRDADGARSEGLAHPAAHGPRGIGSDQSGTPGGGVHRRPALACCTGRNRSGGTSAASRAAMPSRLGPHRPRRSSGGAGRRAGVLRLSRHLVRGGRARRAGARVRLLRLRLVRDRRSPRPASGPGRRSVDRALGRRAVADRWPGAQRGQRHGLARRPARSR